MSDAKPPYVWKPSDYLFAVWLISVPVILVCWLLNGLCCTPGSGHGGRGDPDWQHDGGVHQSETLYGR